MPLLRERCENLLWCRSIRLITPSVRQRQAPIAGYDEVPAALERVIIESNGFALRSPLGVLPEDLWTVYAPECVALQTVVMIDRACRIRQEARQLKRIVRRCQTTLRIRRLQKLALEERYPGTQPLLAGEREDEEPRVDRPESAHKCRLVQLRQMFIAIESAQMAQEDQRDWFGILH